ncbi:hypothetical protein ACO2Q8_18175 [Larkinella sp. VNQ87]|uniref:hypothetical protein n=1 Tax=Larkinella sp. VNQ87 TaxID=3400921 RepID=UPI003C0B4773
MGLLLMGWALAFWGGSSTCVKSEDRQSISTIGKTPKRAVNDPVTDIPHASFHLVFAASTASQKIPTMVGALFSAVRLRFNKASLILPKPVSYFFFAWFRRLFGNQIAINAP